jgi:hypothetical protein
MSGNHCDATLKANEPRRAELALAFIVNYPAIGIGSDSAVVGDKLSITHKFHPDHDAQLDVS